MIKLIFILVIGTFSVVKGNEIKVTGIGKISVAADVADVKVGIELEERTAQDAERAISSQLPAIIASVKSEKVEKLETGAIEIYPEYNQSSPPKIKGYRGKSTISFSAPVEAAGKLIGNAFAAGANVLTQVRVRASDAALEKARIVVLQEASQNALKEAQLVLSNLQLQQTEISTINVLPTDAGIPIYRNTMLSKATADMPILEGEQIVQAQIEMEIKFQPNFSGN